jgi:hypothetical protein
MKSLEHQAMGLKTTSLTTALTLAFTLVVTSNGTAVAQQVLGGDEGLACQAVLCLATGSPPGECTPALSRFYGISYQYWSDTLQGRINFLNQCPVSNQDGNMRSLVNAMANGAGRCDAASLNGTLLGWYTTSGNSNNGRTYILNALPDYCAAYATHPYTDRNTVATRYVGDPMRGGHWVSAANYSQELAAYNARIAAEDTAFSQDSGGF